MQKTATPIYFSIAEVYIDILNNTDYGADIKDYKSTDGKFTKDPSILQSGGVMTQITVSVGRKMFIRCAIAEYCS